MDKTAFKKSNLSEKYDVWVDSMIFSDYYFPARFDDEGNMISEDIIDEEGFDRAKDEILDISITIYDKIAHHRIFTENPIDLGSCIPVDHAEILSDLLRNDEYSSCVLLGSVYFLFVYDYPNYKSIFSNKTLVMRSYNELFTRVSVRENCIKEWLDLYASLRGITRVFALPPNLREESVMVYLDRLKQAGFLDDSYNLTRLGRVGAWRHLIANELYLKGCSYAELEKHFRVANLRDPRSFETFEVRKSRNEANESEIRTYNTIKNCFRP